MFFRGRLWNNYNDILDNIYFDENIIDREKLFKLICLIPIEYFKFIKNIHIISSVSWNGCYKFTKQRRPVITENYLATNKDHAGDYNFSQGTISLYLDKINKNSINNCNKDTEFYRTLLHEIGHSRQLLKKSNVYEYVKLVYENQFIRIPSTFSLAAKYKDMIEEDADEFQMAFENAHKEKLDKISTGIVKWPNTNNHSGLNSKTSITLEYFVKGE